MSPRQIQKINVHLNAAKAYSELSYAKRLKVGSVIIKDDRVISLGYNGTPSGMDNNCENEINGVLVTKQEIVHSEANAILFAARNGISTNNCSLIVTYSPCFECAKMIIQSGIKEVYYEEEYRDISSIKFLRNCGVKVYKIKELENGTN